MKEWLGIVREEGGERKGVVPALIYSPLQRSGWFEWVG